MLAVLLSPAALRSVTVARVRILRLSWRMRKLQRDSVNLEADLAAGRGAEPHISICAQTTVTSLRLSRERGVALHPNRDPMPNACPMPVAPAF